MFLYDMEDAAKLTVSSLLIRHIFSLLLRGLAGYKILFLFQECVREMFERDIILG